MFARHFTLLGLLCSTISCIEVEPASTWEGYLYTQTETGLVALPDAFTALYDQDGTLLTEGFVPNGRPSNFNQLIVDESWAGNNATLRVGGPENQTIQWAGQIPTGASTWIPGALFAADPEYLNAFLSSFAEPANVSLDGSIHLWGEPLDPTAWPDVDITLSDTDGIEYTVYRYSQLDTGLISTNTAEKVDWFFSWNLPEKPLLLTVSLPSGVYAETLYYPQSGDILSALYYALPQTEDE